MKINFSEMTRMIATEVIEQLGPEIRQIVKEEVARGTRRVMKENQTVITNINKAVKKTMVTTPTPTTTNTITETAGVAKEELARRARSRATEIISKKFAEDDPFAELILDAKDPQLDAAAAARVYDDLPMVDITEPITNDIMPEQIDYTAALEKMGI